MNEAIKNWYDKHSGEVTCLAKEIWKKPETAFGEYYACERTSEFLRKHGFRVHTYNCYDASKPPNAVVASWGSGKPVIGIIGEYDALAGLGQEALPFKAPIPGCGHGCGHCLMAPACSSAAIAAKSALEAEGLCGTIKFLATPAEEGGGGKLYMAKDGHFDDVDCCMAWHPKGYDITVSEMVFMSANQFTFEFFGKTAHAASAPEMGRSALDAAELMNVGVQYLREHMTSDSRVHYSYLAAGERPNIVPEYAATDYSIRAKDYASAHALAQRVEKIAQGAAMMTDTEVKITRRMTYAETLIIHSFNRFMHRAVCKVPPIAYTEEEQEFARKLCQNALGEEPAGGVLATGVAALTGEAHHAAGSTDVGHITHMLPVSRLFGYGYAKGIPGHHWGVTATCGMSIGHKAALFAGHALAQCVYDITKQPEVIDEWKEELKGLRMGKTPVPIVLNQTLCN